MLEKINFMRLYLSLILSFLVTSLVAQNKSASKYSEMVTATALKKHLNIIASDSMMGRETGTEGQRMAAQYIQSQFDRIGLKPLPGMSGFQQMYPLRSDSMEESSLSLFGETFKYETDFLVPITENHSSETIADRIIFVGYGIDDNAYSDYNNKDVKGKVVVFFNGEPMRKDRRMAEGNSASLEMKLIAAQNRGAVGAIILDKSSDRFNARLAGKSRRTGMYYAADLAETDNLPHIYMLPASIQKLFGNDYDNILDAAKANMMLNELVAEVGASCKLTIRKSSTIVEASNVVGMIEGTEKKDEYVFITAHYDHLGIRNGKIYNGADDDGSGTVSVIQMAEAFAKAAKEGNGPKRSVVFMTVSGEEKGLWGSEYYSEHPIVPLEKTSVDLNIDMIGRVDTERKKSDTGNYVYVVGHDKISSELSEINEKVNAKTTKLTLDYKFDDPNDPNRIYYRSDHYNFARKGVPVLFFYDGMLKSDYHQPTDDTKFIHWSLFEKRARMIFHTCWEMANRDQMLKRDLGIPEGIR
jgi:hypothetical protein